MSATTTYTISFVIGGISSETIRIKYKANNATTYTVLATLPNLAPGVTHTYTMPPLETHRMYTVILETVCEDATFEFGGIRYLCNFVCSPFTAAFDGSNIDVEWECYVPQTSGDSVKEYRIEYREQGSTSPYSSITIPIATITTYWGANPGTYPMYTHSIVSPAILPGITYEINHYTVIEYNFYGPSGTPTPVQVTINSSSPCSTLLEGVLCETCDLVDVVDFVSNPGADGWYVDDTSNLLVRITGGVIGSIFEQEAAACSPSSVPGGSIIDRGMIVASAKTFVYDNPPGLASTITVFDNTTYAVLTTITLPYNANPALNITIEPTGIAYSPVDGYIYFTSNLSNPGVSTWRRVHRLDPLTYTITYNICGDLGPIGAFTTFVRDIFIHPVTNIAYIPNNLGDSYIVDLNTDTQVGLLGYSFSSAAFNTANDEMWVINQAPDDIRVYNGTTHLLVATIANSFGYIPKVGSANGSQFSIAYYPGDGTPGSDRMFATYQDVGNTNFYLLEYLTSGPYTDSVFTTYPWVGAPVNIIYIPMFNKLMYTVDNVVRAFAPTDGTTEFANVTLTSLNPCRPVVDPDTNQVVYHSFASCPGDNVLWVGLDVDFAEPCDEGIVELYVGADGPYFWDASALTWNSLCNTILVGPVAGAFTVTATFPAAVPAPAVLKAALEISTDGGTTWALYEDQSGDLYDVPGQWNLGRNYNDPGVPFNVRVSFTTSTCTLKGVVI
jgi:hypothetical protein